MQTSHKECAQTGARRRERSSGHNGGSAWQPSQAVRFALALGLVLAGACGDGSSAARDTADGATDAGSEPDAAQQNTQDASQSEDVELGDFETTDCSFEPAVTTRLSGASPTDCGHVGLDTSDADAKRMQQCVIDAFAAKQPFVLYVTPYWAGSVIEEAYVWPGKGPVRVLHHDSDLSAGEDESAKPYLSERSCDELEVLPTCRPSASNMCFQCPGAVSVTCYLVDGEVIGQW